MGRAEIRKVRLGAWLAAFLLARAVLLTGVAPAFAQSANSLISSYITPFPDNESYKVLVLGGPLADGVFAGLQPLLAEETAIDVSKQTDPATGLARQETTDWVKLAETKIATEQVDIAVVVFGVEDRVSIRLPTGKLDLGSDDWQQEYGRRVDRLIKSLRKKGAAVYWLGLPVMRPTNANADAQMFNGIYRDKTAQNGVRFVETFDGFVDQNGAFTGYGPDLTGKVRQLRTDDGIYFTGRGYEKLAHYVAQAIRRDLALARSERLVPLDGAEDEQGQIAKLNGGAGAAAAGKDGQAVSAKAAEKGLPDTPSETATIELRFNEAGGAGGKVKIEIIRPAIPGAVLAHLQRSPQSKATEIGGTLSADLNNGISAMSSIALVKSGGLSGAGTPDRVPLTEQPYYKVLVKGETLTPKLDRADDFSWPKQQDQPSG